MTWAIWITGLPGSGKSAVARAAAAELAAAGQCVQVLELDDLRRTLTPSPRYDAAERDAVYRALVVMAHVITRAGYSVVIDATAHRREWRELARVLIVDFAEVQLVCPLDVARAREQARGRGRHPSGIYARAGRPGATVPGVDVPYEAAAEPELTIDTTSESVDAAGARVAALARTFARHIPGPGVANAWTIWITGRPGSGKTTVVAGVCERLSRRGIRVCELAAAEFAATVAPDGALSPVQADIVGRAVLETARRLNALGIVVVIDGALPGRETGERAREVVARLARVELECPPEIARTRERAVRWNLVPCPFPRPAADAPDLGLDYEAATTPDLILHTDVRHVSMTADEIVCLVDRLARSAEERTLSCA